MFLPDSGYYQLFTTYHDPEAREKAYSAALLIGIGSLLWVHLLWFLPLFWLGMYNFRSLTSRTFIASLLGVATVYWFLLGWCVWQRDFTLFNVPFSTLFKVRLLATDGIVLLDWISIMADCPVDSCRFPEYCQARYGRIRFAPVSFSRS